MEYRFLWFISTCNNDFEANSTSLMSLWAKFFPEPTGELYGWLLATLVKSHHVMMTFLVFDLDILFIPCYSFFFLSAASIALPYLKNYR